MKKLLLFLLLSIPAFAQHSVKLTWSWTQAGDPATGFIVQRASVSGGPYTTICGGTGQPVCPPVATLTYTDTAGLVGGATWYYVVEATGPGGVSGPSNEAKAVIPFLPPAAPSNLQSTSN